MQVCEYFRTFSLRPVSGCTYTTTRNTPLSMTPSTKMALLMLMTLFVHVTLTTAQSGSPCTVDTTSEYYKGPSSMAREGVLENIPIGSPLMELPVVGAADGAALLTAVSGDSRVALDVAQRRLTVAEALGSQTSASDAADIRNIELTLTCQIQATQQEVSLLIIITVQQVNDNPPVFVGAPYSAQVSELAVVGSIVFSGIQTEDLDGDAVFYKIQPSQYSSHFQFANSARGVVTLKTPLDYESLPAGPVVVTVVAYDNLPDGHTATAALSVTVTDADDQNPEFVGGPYEGRVAEDAPLDTVVPLTPALAARDPDVAVNSPLEFSIVSDGDAIHGDSSFFSADSQTGELRLIRDTLVRGKTYVFLVKVTQLDNPDRYSTALVRITVQAANLSRPRFLQSLYTASVVENLPVGTSVLAVSATDNDEEYTSNKGTVLEYMFDPNESVTDFTIDKTTGVLSLARPLDAGARLAYTFQVTATDGTHTVSTVVEVTVLDVNDHSPVFSHHHGDGTVYVFDAAAVTEDSRVLGTVAAADADPSATITYSLLDANNTLFSVDAATGAISLQENADVLEDTYTLVVVASDNTPPRPRSTAAVVHIRFGGDVAGPATAASAGSYVAAVIALGVITGLLLIAIAVLLLLCYRNNSKEANAPMRSQSFERNLNFASKDYKSYLAPPAELPYKQTRHLEVYDNVNLPQDEDSTQTALNPFQSTFQSGRTGSSSMYSQQQQQAQAPASSSHYTIAGVTQSQTSVSRQMHEINEIDYETAVAPMEYYDPPSDYDSTLPKKRGSDDSGETESMNSGAGNTGAYKMGSSTQKLVTAGGSDPRVATIGGSRRKLGGSNLSFIDSPINSLYSSNSSQIAPTAGAVGSQDRPGITIYY